MSDLFPERSWIMGRFDWTFSGSAEVVTALLLVLVLITAALS